MNDTICAVSTPAGVGGVAMVRLSGPQAKETALKFMPSVKDFTPRRATFAGFHFIDAVGTSSLRQRSLLDEVVATYFPAPHSYTGEEVMEISCHGSLYVQQAILQCLIDEGTRLAEPGEFTRRAFLSGRLNLSQAEAVADLVDSVNAASHRLAISQLRGGYCKELSDLRAKLLELTSLLELELDFSEEDVEFADRHQLIGLVDVISKKTNALCDGFRLGNAIKKGVPVAIAGRPNVGKSTLLNALLKEDRAIVSSVPGTTRDTIEDSLTLEGIQFRIVDTAGLRNSDDVIEREGIARSIKAVEKAQIVLYLVDASMKTEIVEYEFKDFCRQASVMGKNVVLIFNKSDAAPSGGMRGVASAPQMGERAYQTLRVSAKFGDGIGELEHMLVEAVRSQMPPDDTLVTNLRHFEALGHIRDAMQHVDEGLRQKVPADLVSIDLRAALHYLGEITGEVTANEVLGNIFSRFCVGK